ncbi:unnamed protein product [Prunus armeniaca]
MSAPRLGPGVGGGCAHLLLIKTCRSASWAFRKALGFEKQDPWAFGRLDLELELAVTRELSVPRQALAVSTHSAGGTWHSSFGKRDLEYLLLRQGDLAAGFRAFQFQQGGCKFARVLGKEFFRTGLWIFFRSPA